jgi:2-keto-4-pentenoate hydratase/2-oxohepta-3-ene-1,7-dioic acid hydratase in catechol pathway
VRLISFLLNNEARLGVEAGGRALAATELLDSGPRTMAELLERGAAGLADLRHAAHPSQIEDRGIPVGKLALLAPVPRPGKVVAIARNYSDHAAEEGLAPPSEPAIFSKWSTAVIGSGAEIRWDPELTSKVDYEAELAVVIGRPARHVSVAEALDCVLGYTCLNDVSARDLQFGDAQWMRGKSLDTFCPMGPVLVTADELPEPGNLEISCRVNDAFVQAARTADMYFGVAELIAYCSRSFTLEPGDVIATGTPGGVGHNRKPPVYLRDGDEVVVSIYGIGELVNTCRFEGPDAD